MTADACPTCGHQWSPRPLSKRQRQVYDFIRRYLAEHGVTPTYREIAEAFGWASLATVAEHLDHLEAKGYIVRTYNEVRGMRVLEQPAVAA